MIKIIGDNCGTRIEEIRDMRTLNVIQDIIVKNGCLLLEKPASTEQMRKVGTSVEGFWKLWDLSET